MKKGNLASQVATKTKENQAKAKADAAKNAGTHHAHPAGHQHKTFDNYEIAVQIMKAKRRNEEAFPSKDIETLVEMAIKVVAANFQLYPSLDGVNDTHVQSEVDILKFNSVDC